MTATSVDITIINLDIFTSHEEVIDAFGGGPISIYYCMQKL